VRTIAIGTIAIALLAAACASPTSVDVDSLQDAESPVSASPATTSPVAASPATTSPVTASPVTTSPVATSPPTTSDIALSDESATPIGDQDDGTEPAEQEATVTTQPPRETSETPSPIEAVEPRPSGPVAGLVADLATRLGIDESDVTLVSHEEVTWPDSSLGCPQKGMEYTQVLVNGSLIVLKVNGATYEYHSGSSRDPFYCSNPTEPVSGDSGDV